MAFLAGNGDGTFRSPIYSNPAWTINGPLVAGEFSGNGKLGLVSYGPSNSIVGGVVVMAGHGDGTFQPPLAFGVTGFPAALVVGDFNSDGASDFAIPTQSFSTQLSVALLYLSAPTPNLFPTRLNFGSVPVGQTSPPKSIVLTNTGNAVLRLSRIAVTGDFLQHNNCGKTLDVGKSCTTQVSFKPTATGFRTGTLSIADNAASSPQKVALSGTGE
jgi:hypothetical protein